MKIGIALYSKDPETAWNAFRFGVFALAQGDEVKVFLLGKGVEVLSLEDPAHDVRGQIQLFKENGGEIIACGVCLEARNSKDPAGCPVGSMNDLYEVVAWADRVISF